VSRDLLNELARRSPPVPSPLAEVVRRAAFFDHQVWQGGFALLIFNLQGDGLEGTETMLETVGAPVAKSFYLRAIQECVADLESYQAFLADYMAESLTKNALFRVSLDFYRSGVEFPDEILPWLAETNRAL
jgi:hypothetical protein